MRSLFAQIRSSVALTFALTTVPIMLTVGGAIDFSRSVHYRAELQGVADSASLAAAMLWQGGNSSTAATTAAGNYITAGVAKLPGNGGVSNTVTASAVANGYQVEVRLTSSMKTTFLGKALPSLAVSVVSVALNPKPFGHFCAGSVSPTTGLCASNVSAFSASAADTNSVYWYKVPSDGSIPPDTSMTLLWSNASNANNNPQPIPLEPGDEIGFAMRNTTGDYGQSCTGSGRNKVCTQRTNGYGSAKGHTQTFYSHLVPPSNSTKGYNSTNNPTNVNSVNGATGKNCALQVTVNNASTGAATAPTSGSCKTYNDANATTYARPSCTQLGGKMVTFFFNDMGGTGDDMDYNDAVFTYYCGGNGTGAGGATGSTVARSVILTQ